MSKVIIDLPTFDSSKWCICDQIPKIIEELNELLEAFGFDGCSDDKVKNHNILSELLDLTQACKTGIEIFENKLGSQFVALALQAHREKLEERHRTGKIKLLMEEEGVSVE